MKYQHFFNKTMSLGFLLTSLSVLAGGTNYYSNEYTYGRYMMLGVFQEPVCDLTMADHNLKEIAVAFIKDKTVWRAATPDVLPVAINATLNWSILYHGGLVQQVPTNSFSPKNKKRFPLYEIKLDKKLQIPQTPITNGTFYGWCGPRSYLPMAAAVNGWGGNVHHWDAFVPSDDVKKLIYPVFKNNVGIVYQCVNSQVNKSQVPYDYQVDDLKIYQSYKSDNGEALISVKVDPAKTKCSSQEHLDSGYQWFVFNKTMQYLGGSMELIDYGDYDASGQNQFLFWHTSYNEDGYMLFYDNFSKSTKFYWSYD